MRFYEAWAVRWQTLLVKVYYRQAKHQRMVSASIVFEANKLLKSRRMILCSPQSGY